MARSTAEIRAEIAMTRHGIEEQLDAVRRRVPHPWWTPYAVLAGALAVGLVASRLPMMKLVATGVRAAQTGLAIASTAGAVRRLVADRPRPRKAA